MTETIATKTAKHTPGPWHSVLLHPQYILNSKQQGFLKITTDNGPEISCAELRANCNLIAAAPDLLCELKHVRMGLNCVCRINAIVRELGAGIECLACRIDAVPAKATSL